MPNTLKINITDIPNPPPPSPTLFTHLKSQILSLALALYGSTSSSPTSAFDIITYTKPLPASLHILLDGRDVVPSTLYGAALIAYTSPGEFTAWERVAVAENSGGWVEAMGELLGDMRRGDGEGDG